jgi:hypothetical protein
MQTTTAGTIRLARTAEIPEGTGREFKVGERYIAVFARRGTSMPLKMSVHTLVRR